MLAQFLVLAAETTGQDEWADVFFGLNADERFLMLMFGGFMLMILLAIILQVLDAAHRRRTQADLKREMLDRGMSVDEIVKVIEAAPTPKDAKGRK